MYISRMARSVPIQEVPGHPAFRALREVPGIRTDLRYAGPNNFVGADLYSPFDCAWIHRDGAERLEAAAAWLAAQGMGIELVVLDALRPQRVQQRLWESLPPELRIYLADPAIGSIHSFGMAVDVTLADATGRELDMGTPFDDLTERSHPVLEEQFLASGGLGAVQVANRRLLRAAMEQAGWRGIRREWWHFDGADRDMIRARYLRVL